MNASAPGRFAAGGRARSVVLSALAALIAASLWNAASRRRGQ